MKAAERHSTPSRSRAQRSSTQGSFFQPERSESKLSSSPKAFFQPKLKVGAPNDKYEKEADSVADQVVQRLANPAVAPPTDASAGVGPSTSDIRTSAGVDLQPVRSPISRIQRSERIQREAETETEAPEEGLDLQRKAIFESAEDGGTVQRSGDGSFTTSDSFSSKLSSNRGSGSPLSDSTRTNMEGAIGADFSGVRVHTGSEASSLNNEIGAKAFTHGNDIYFNDGQYNPNSNSGQHLLAHELTHTVQQGRGNEQLNRSIGIEEKPEEKIKRLIADKDNRGIVGLTDGELAFTSAVERAGMIKILVDLWWTGYNAERFIIHALRFRGQSAKVLLYVDALGYRLKLINSIDDEELSKVLLKILARVEVNKKGGDLPISEVLVNPKSTYEDVMPLTNLVGATNSQRLGLLKIMLALNWSNGAEESKIVDILESSGNGLYSLMIDLTGLGLKQSLFDHIDHELVAFRFTKLILSLNDPTLNADLEVFNRGFLGNMWEGFVGGLGAAVENFSVGTIVMGFLQPIIDPIESILSVISQVEDAIINFDFSIETLDKIVTFLRDAAGFVVVWLMLLSAIAALIVAAVVAGVITIPAAIPIGAIAAGLSAFTVKVGVVFVVLAVIKFIIDLIQSGGATTSRELSKEQDDLEEDVTLIGVILVLAGVFKLIGLTVEGFKKSAVEPEKARPEALKKTAEQTNESVEKIGEKAKETKGEVENVKKSTEKPNELGDETVDEGKRSSEKKADDYQAIDGNLVPRIPVLKPGVRHFANRVSQKTMAKKMNTVIGKKVPVAQDISAINMGRAVKGRAPGGEVSYTVNGRTYGAHPNGRLYPISGEGFIELNRGAYKALGVYNQLGKSVKAEAILDSMEVPNAERLQGSIAHEMGKK